MPCRVIIANVMWQSWQVNKKTRWAKLNLNSMCTQYTHCSHSSIIVCFITENCFSGSLRRICQVWQSGIKFMFIKVFIKLLIMSNSDETMIKKINNKMPILKYLRKMSMNVYIQYLHIMYVRSKESVYALRSNWVIWSVNIQFIYVCTYVYYACR